MSARYSISPRGPKIRVYKSFGIVYFCVGNRSVLLWCSVNHYFNRHTFANETKCRRCSRRVSLGFDEWGRCVLSSTRTHVVRPRCSPLEYFETGTGQNVFFLFVFNYYKYAEKSISALSRTFYYYY